MRGRTLLSFLEDICVFAITVGAVIQGGTGHNDRNAALGNEMIFTRRHGHGRLSGAVGLRQSSGEKGSVRSIDTEICYRNKKFQRVDRKPTMRRLPAPNGQAFATCQH